MHSPKINNAGSIIYSFDKEVLVISSIRITVIITMAKNIITALWERDIFASSFIIFPLFGGLIN